LDQYCELPFEGIATGEELCACELIQSDSMFARRHQEMISRLKPGISIKKVMITTFFTARQLIKLDDLPNGKKSNQD
jgi:hypothetical protein